MAELSNIQLVINVIANSSPLDKMAASMAKVQGATASATATATKSGQAAQLAGSRWGGWNDALSRFQRQSWAAQAGMTYMKTAGRSLLNVSRQLTDVAGDLTSRWGDFEFALLRAAGAAGVFDRQSPMFDNIKASILDATRSLKFYAAQDVATNLYKWASGTGQVIETQKDLNAAMSATAAVMKVASLNGADVESVMNGVISVVKTFHLPLSKAKDVAELFNYAAVKTTLEVGDLTQTLKYVAPVAYAMGDSIQTVVGILAKLGDAGIKGSRAGTALRQFYSNILKMTPKAKTALDKLFKAQGGVAKVLYNSKGKFKGAENYIWQLAKATKNMTDQQKNALLANISTASSMPALIALVDSATRAQKNGAKSYKEATDIQKEATETTQKQWALLEGSWNGVVATLKSSVEPVLLHIGEILARQFTPALKDAAKFVTDVVDPWVKANPDLITAAATIGAIAAALTALSGAFLLVSGTIGNVGISAVLGFVKVAGLLITPLLTLATTVLPAIVSAVLAIGAPFLVIGAIIAGAVAAYLTNFMGFKDFVDGVVQWLVTNLPQAINTALGVIAGIINAVISPITDKLPAIISFLQGIVSSLAETWVPVFQHLGEVAGEVFGNLIEVVQEVAASVMEHVGPLVDELSKLGAVIYDFIGPAWNFFVTVVGAVLGAILKAVIEFINAIAPYVQGFVDLFLRAFGVVAEFVIRTVGNFVNTVIDVIKGFVKVIEGIIEVFTGLLTGNWDKVWKGLQHIVGGFVDAVTGLIGGLITQIGTVIDSGLKAIGAIFEFIFGVGPGSIVKAVTDGIGKAAKAIGDFATNIVGFFTGVPGKMASIGKDIIEGLWNGIKSLAGWIADKVSALIKDIIPGPVRDVLGISSPSKVMAELGDYAMQGLARGIVSNTDAIKAMQSQAAAVVKAADLSGISSAAVSADLGGTINSRSTSDRTQTIKIEVSSPDGTVNESNVMQLQDMVNGITPSLVRSLERMSATD